ncbi:MAG: response regulator transcription factor [Verrucomicrobia bacterium]|nr:response regulator transcription factor [Verrucomicrobiota bacterium]
MPKALIIDDEPPARAVLRALLGAHPTVAVVGEAGTVGAAQALLAGTDYDLVFLDIQLRGGSGFDLAPRVRPGAAVVFVTAHDEHALRAFEVNALDYLLKPVKPERLAATLARLGGQRTVEAGTGPARGLKINDTVHVRTDDGARFLPLATVVLLHSCENYCELHLVGGEVLLVRHTLKAWEDSLPAPPFARAHRQAIINLSHLRRVEDDGADAPLLHLAGLRAPLRASRREWPNLRTRLPRQTGEAVHFGA